MGAASEPQHVSRALSELIALRGLARFRGEAELANIWNELAGSAIAAQTRVLGIRRNVLNVGVSNSALLSELASFYRTELLQKLQERWPELQIKELKFRLDGRLGDGQTS